MMAGSASNQGDIFDVKRIRRLVELMNEHELAEIDLRQADQRIRLRKGGEPVVTDRRSGRRRRRPRPPPAERPRRRQGGRPTSLVIKSPMVGTFYAAPSPDAPPFVKVGDHVGPDDHGLHRRGHEGLQRDSGRSVGPDRGRAGRERRAGRVRPAAVQGRSAQVAPPDVAVATSAAVTTGGSMFKRILVANRGEIALRDHSRLPRAGHRDRGHLQRGRPRRRLPRAGRRGLLHRAAPRPPTAT